MERVSGKSPDLARAGVWPASEREHRSENPQELWSVFLRVADTSAMPDSRENALLGLGTARESHCFQGMHRTPAGFRNECKVPHRRYR